MGSDWKYLYFHCSSQVHVTAEALCCCISWELNSSSIGGFSCPNTMNCFGKLLLCIEDKFGLDTEGLETIIQ
ncbi:hypothetical protein OROGR_025543 [Orobanche gracilis]